MSQGLVQKKADQGVIAGQNDALSQDLSDFELALLAGQGLGQGMVGSLNHVFSASPETLDVLQRHDLGGYTSLEELLALNASELNGILEPLHLRIEDFQSLSDLQNALLDRLSDESLLSALGLSGTQLYKLKNALAVLQGRQGSERFTLDSSGDNSPQNLSKEERDALNDIIAVLSELVPTQGQKKLAQAKSLNNERAIGADQGAHFTDQAKSDLRRNSYSLHQFMSDTADPTGVLKGDETLKAGKVSLPGEGLSGLKPPTGGQSNGPSPTSFQSLMMTLGMESWSGFSPALGVDTGAMDAYKQAYGASGYQGNPASASGSSQLLTLNQGAMQAHPASQIVAATLTKGAQDAQSKTLRLQLDPPELGRIEVRMHFGKDKMMSAKVITEKSETHLMLQRDSQLLERALQQSGIETGDGGLSFEMAQEGYQFSQNGRHDGSRQPYSSGDGDGDEALEVIETTMNWHVDPESGHTRYDILA